MSGGVDSAVAAGLLQRQGFRVSGVFARGWEPPLPTGCVWRAERRDALRAAARLKIPLFTLDLSGDYERLVVRPMLEGYRRGETPNPDVLCNREIKFGLLAQTARARGFDYLATGHYARREEKSGRFLLKRGRDENKDQSYFLWTLKQDDLERALFPIGDYEKPKVRALARRWGLPQAEKKDSQGLCFVGQLDFKDFLRQQLKPEPGDVLDESGKKIGRHDGAALYTIGERHGFAISDSAMIGRPRYVVGKNVAANTIIVSPIPPAESQNKKPVNFHSVNWLNGEPPDLNKTYQAQVRYRQVPIAGRLETIDGRWRFDFEKPVAAAPGQSLVIYDSDILIGGGVIG